MDKSLNNKYNIPARVNLEQPNKNEIAIVKKIKSRIIMKTSIQIVEIADKIRALSPDVKITLKCNDNICSKSLKFLADNGINVLID